MAAPGPNAAIALSLVRALKQHLAAGVWYDAGEASILPGRAYNGAKSVSATLPGYTQALLTQQWQVLAKQMKIKAQSGLTFPEDRGYGGAGHKWVI